MRITNYELQITRPARFFPALVILCALCAFAGTAFAQSNLEFFAETIRRGNVEQKRDALFQIRNLENAAASGVAVSALTDKSEIVRATAAFSVIFLPADEAVAVLSPLLNDKKELVRREAAYALGKTRNPGAVNSLLRILQKDKILEVRAASVVALGEIGDASAVPELVKILQRKPIEKEEFLRRSAARSIGQIARIIQTNKVKVQTPEDFLPDKNISIAEPKYPNLIEAFPTFRAANAALIQTLQNPREADDVKRETAFALGAIGDASAIPVLQSNSDAEDYYLAQISREALRKIRLLRKLTSGNKSLPNRP
ncbi:MAG TPA: HEAT repeat domain-containing protein [Pyrinomonadaceae bacterium]|nr:HEAT repeat domain-containing protein [Pyrinomonadaceae bacterium]